MLHSALDSKELMFCDGDGTLWFGQTSIPGVDQALKTLNEQLQILFLTNNSTKSRKQHAQKFQRITGLELPIDNIISVSWATARYLLQHVSPPGPLFVIGEYGLFYELETVGYNFVDGTEPEKVTAVVVGVDRQFTFDKLKLAMRALLKGAKFVGTNPDPDYPGNRGLAPGCGSLLAAIETASGKKAEVIGKPNPIFLEQALDAKGVEKKNAVLVGDRMSTDIACAAAAGILSIRVKTGIHEEGPFKFKPDLEMESFADLITRK